MLKFICFTHTTFFKIFIIVDIIILTFIDLVRVASFDSRADIPFFIVTVILNLIFVLDIVSKFLENGN